MNKIRFMSIIGALMIASVGMAGCKERPAPASSDDGEAVVTTTTTELVVPIPTTTTVTEPTTTTEATTTTTTTTKKEVVTTTKKAKATKKAKVTTTTKATKKAKVTTTKKKDSGGNLSVGGGTKPKGNTDLVGAQGQPIRKKSDGTYEMYLDGIGWFPCDISDINEKGGVKEIPDDGKGIGKPVPGAH